MWLPEVLVDTPITLFCLHAPPSHSHHRPPVDAGEDVSGSTSQFLDVFDGEGAVVARVPADSTGAWVAHAALVATATAAVAAATAAPLPVADSEVL